VLEDDAAEGQDEREKRVDKVLWGVIYVNRAIRSEIRWCVRLNPIEHKILHLTFHACPYLAKID
jgi:hypothetical protein